MGPKVLHRLRRLTTLWGGRSSGFGKASAIAPQTSLFGVKKQQAQPAMLDSPVPSGKTIVWVPVPVQTVVFAELLEKIHLIIPESKKLIKMDVEGCEYEVLEQMLEKQLLCKTRVDAMSIEWHLSKLLDLYHMAYDQKTIQRDRDIEHRLKKGVRMCSESEPTKVLTLDDESFVSDGNHCRTNEC